MTFPCGLLTRKLLLHFEDFLAILVLANVHLAGIDQRLGDVEEDVSLRIGEF